MEYNPFSLKDKTILVTGASSGIGKETAVSCSKMGASLIITGRNQERLQETYDVLEGAGNVQVIADLTIQDEMDSLVNQIEKIDGVVLCAGKGLTKPVLFSDKEQFTDLFNVNFFAPVELLRQLIRKNRFNKNSSAVFIVSIGGTGRWTPGNAIYGSSKAALQSIIRYFAIELASKKIRVNGICPGMIETPLIYGGMIDNDQLEQDRANYPLKRYGQPVDVANGAVYLLSNASSWVTGTSLVIDGGITAK